jgi:alpha-tubulin suppressor-like RCC1 family protein
LGNNLTSSSTVLIRPTLINKNIIDVACGGAHTAILTDDPSNNLYTCGTNQYGNLGNGTIGNPGIKIFQLTTYTKKVIDVYCGGDHTMIMTDDSSNNIYACGINNNGQLGIGNFYFAVF